MRQYGGSVFLVFLLLLLSVSYICAQNSTVPASCGGPLAEDRSVYTSFYDADNGDTILKISLKTTPYLGFTWKDIINDTDGMDTFEPIVLCNVTVNGTTMNCTAERRGDWSRESPLPSLKVKLSGSTIWRAMDRLLLNKHPWDTTRVRNKITYELLQKVPNQFSLYTQFVELTVDDTYYGLYTLVEDLGKNMLEKHALGKNAWLYKPNNLYWDLSELSRIKLKTDPAYNKSLFERVMDIRGNSDHTHLIQLFQDLNNPNLDSYSAIANNINVDNFATWLAMQYLIASYDLRQSNYAFYAPEPNPNCSATTLFYWVFWDNDGAWEEFYLRYKAPNLANSWKEGLGYYASGIKVVDRFLRVDSFVDLFRTKLTYLYNTFLQRSNLTVYTNKFKPVIKPILSIQPDVSALEAGDLASWDDSMDFMPKIPGLQYNLFSSEYLYRPFPVNMYMRYASTDKSSIFFYWEQSFVLYNQNLYYEMALSISNKFTSTVVSFPRINNTWVSVATSALAVKTTYYWRVRIRNAARNTSWVGTLQIVGEDDTDSAVYGAMKFISPTTIASLTTLPVSVSITLTQVVQVGSVNYVYATIDNTNPASTTLGCSSTFLPLPTGYAIAPNSALTRSHIALISKPWGTSSLVLSDGNRVNSTTGLFIDAWGKAGYDSFTQKLHTGNTFSYAAQCDNATKRILVVKLI